MAKRWKKGQDEVSASAPAPTTSTTSEEKEDNYTPLPAAHIDDEEMNDES